MKLIRLLLIFFLLTFPLRGYAKGEYINVLDVNHYITPQMFGAKADGVKDDSRAIQLAADEASKEGKVLLLSGSFAISKSISISSNTDGSNSKIIFQGARNQAAIRLADIQYKSISFGDIVDVKVKPELNYYGGWHGWADDNYIGILVENCICCAVSVNRVVDFTVGIELRASENKGIAWNKISFEHLYSNKIGLHFNYIMGGWINANTFDGGRIDETSAKEFSSHSTVSRYGIKQTIGTGYKKKLPSSNGNIFRNLWFENHFASEKYTCIYLNCACNWIFDGVRIEIEPNSNNKFVQVDLNQSISSQYQGGHPLHNQIKNITYSTTTEIEYLNLSPHVLSCPLCDIVQIEDQKWHTIYDRQYHPIDNIGPGNKIVLGSCEYSSYRSLSIKSDSNNYPVSYNGSWFETPFDTGLALSLWLKVNYLESFCIEKDFWDYGSVQIGLKCYDDKGKIIDDASSLGIDAAYNNVFCVFPYKNRVCKFSVTSEKVKYVKLLFPYFSFIRISADNNAQCFQTAPRL